MIPVTFRPVFRSRPLLCIHRHIFEPQSESGLATMRSGVPADGVNPTGTTPPPEVEPPRVVCPRRATNSRLSEPSGIACPTARRGSKISRAPRGCIYKGLGILAAGRGSLTAGVLECRFEPRRTEFEAQAANVAWICRPRIRCVKRALMNDDRWSALNRSWRAGRAPERSNGDTLRVVVSVRIHCPPAPQNSKGISGCWLAK